MTPRELKQRLCDKIELIDSEFFDIVAIENNQERWLQEDIPISLQNVCASTKLLLKLRILYRDINELTEGPVIYLYYLQAKHFILSGFTPITENQVLELAAFQLQAAFGDFDQTKSSTFG